MKVVINKCWGGFGLSQEAYEYWETWIAGERTCPLLIRVVEELGEKANGPHAKLKVVEIPDGIEWEIDEYARQEHIAQKHQTWG